MNAPDFWNEPDKAQQVVVQMKVVRAIVDPVQKIGAALEDVRVLRDLAEQENDDETRVEVKQQLTVLQQQMNSLEFRALLSGKHDGGNCFLSIYAGDGGTEANDWSEMLFRMYLRYCETQGWKVQEIDRRLGEEVGIKDVTLHVTGSYTYGYLSCERGTHRLARVSPFNAQGKRQTSFASVDVVPELEQQEFQLDEKELDLEFFARSSGPGGQNVNKLATACRVVHKLTGLSVVCSNERSQQQNKRQALAILQGKLEQLEEEKREAQRLAASGGKLETGWGTQIRSYVFYDNRVKDTRTGYEVGDPQRVIDGDLHGFITAELQQRAKQRSKI